MKVEKKISQSLEDYLESILIILKSGKKPRIKDIAAFLGVKAPSVVDALSSLEKKGYILYKRYGEITFTDAGREKAEKVYRKHILLKKFFEKTLCLDDKTSEEDACKIEHFLSERSLERILDFVNYMENNPDNYDSWKRYLKGICVNEK